MLSKHVFYPRLLNYGKYIKKLSNKYKIVILGERAVEMRKEYESSKSNVFGLYEQIIANIPTDRIIDLTVPSFRRNCSRFKRHTTRLSNYEGSKICYYYWSWWKFLYGYLGSQYGYWL